MGQTTLKEFRLRMGLKLNTDLEADLFTMWVNSGYFEVVGAIQFDQFKRVVDFPIAAGTSSILLDDLASDRVLGVTRVYDYENDQELEFMNAESFMELKPPAVGGSATHWTVLGDSVKIWEPSRFDLSLSIAVIVEPPKLHAAEDRTLLPTTWDEAVYLLAMEKALLDMDKLAESKAYGDRAVFYMGSRLKDGDYDMRREGGVRVVSTEAELRAVRQRYSL